MFDVPADAMQTWTALALVSAAFFGIALGAPTTPPPDATAAAATVNAVAASQYPGDATQPIHADEINIEPRRLALRNAGGTGHARFLTPVTPAPPNGRLEAVLHGRAVRAVFATPAAFERAADSARARARARTSSRGSDRRADDGWRPAGEELLVRKVTWGGCHVTLVGA